jgi:3-oxoacyl-[acyl-carrier protein] reductase
MNTSLTGKTAVVCGSTQGIGLAIAEELALLGATCILLARNETSLKEAVSRLHSDEQQNHTYHVADFSKPEDVRTAIEEIVAKTNVHILINNSGGPKAGAIIDAHEDDFVKGFSQHIVCNQILTKAVVPGMKKEGYGRIINIISTSVKIPLNNLGVSNTIRAAVASWAKTMSNELGQFNITVNNILPGYTKTARLDSLIEGVVKAKNSNTETIEKEMEKDIPMKRFGEASEIAAVAAFLATPAASYVTGTSIRVDGGRTGSI